MGANELEAARSFGPFAGTLIVVLMIMVPTLIPLLRREKKKPTDQMPAIQEALRRMEKQIETNSDDIRDQRRDFDKLERRVDLYQAIKDMNR